jgi:uncharacterized protein (DUF849 family)
MSQNLPMVIAVAPNGARKTLQDHPALPLSCSELVETAWKCYEAGASMMHFHVRDEEGRHTLAPEIYRPVLDRLNSELGDKLLLQVSSEAAGRYGPDEQVEAMKQLAPHCLSLALRELLPNRKAHEKGARYLSELSREGVLVQYILYSPAEVAWYEALCTDGILPGETHLLLFVLGRYDKPQTSCDLDPYLEQLRRKSPWMACTFGPAESLLARKSAEHGGHIRVGFENNVYLPDGTPAMDNRELVRIACKAGQSAGRTIADKQFAVSVHTSGR